MGRRAFLVALSLTVLAILGRAASAPATGATACDRYAAEALADIEQAKKFGCAFRGLRWVTDIGAHHAWCLGHAPADVRDEAAARAQDVRLCLCQWYGERAAAQAAANAARKCGFGGPRWTPDQSAHYRWCALAKPPVATLQSEVETRDALLADCKP